MKYKNYWGRFCFLTILGVLLCSCGGNSSNNYVEDRVVTSDTYVDGNGVVSFRGGAVQTVWKNKWKDGHQFRATIKSGHNVISTTKCDYCGHMYYVHYDQD